MVVLLVLFLFAATAIDMYTSANNLNNIGNNGGDILYFFAQSLSGPPIAYLMVLAVLSSTVATHSDDAPAIEPALLLDGPGWRFPENVRDRAQELADPVGGHARDHRAFDPGHRVDVHRGGQQPVREPHPRDRGAGRLLLRNHGHRLRLGFSEGALHLTHAVLPRRTPSPGRWPLPVLDRISGGLSGRPINASNLEVAAPVLIAFGLGIPLTIVAAVTNKTGFFHQKTVSYVKQNGRLVAATTGGSTMELAGATAGAPSVPVASVAPSTPLLRADRAASNTRRREGGTRGAPGSPAAAESGGWKTPVGHPWRSTRRPAFPSNCPAPRHCRSTPSHR